MNEGVTQDWNPSDEMRRVVFGLIAKAKAEGASQEGFQRHFGVQGRAELESILNGDTRPGPQQLDVINQAFITSHLAVDDIVVDLDSEPTPSTWACGSRRASWSLGETATTNAYQPQSVTLAEIAERATTISIGTKEGPAFCPATFKDGIRNNNGSLRIDLMGLDVDDGTPFDEIVSTIKRAGVAAVVYTSASHLTTVSSVKADHVEEWRNANGDDAERYLIEVKRYRPEVAAGARFGEVTAQTKRRRSHGQWVDMEYRRIAIHHAPMPKCRIILPMAKAWAAKAYGGDVKLAHQAWKMAVLAVADRLGLVIDRSCTDAARLFYFSRVPDQAALERSRTAIVDGDLIDALSDIDVDKIKAFEQSEKARTTHAKKARSGLGLGMNGARCPGITVRCPVTGQQLALDAWAARYGSGFQIVEACGRGGTHDADGVVTAWPMRTTRGVMHHCDCPFEHEHSVDTPEGTAVVNASDSASNGFAVICRHDHCQGRDRLDFVARAIELGWLSVEDLGNPDFIHQDTLDRVRTDQEARQRGGGQSEARKQRDGAHAASGEAEVDANSDWPEPVDFLRGKTAPEFPIEYLPPDFAEIVEAYAEDLGTPIAGVAMALLAACAGALPNQCLVRVRTGDDGWLEKPRLWVLLVGNSASGKSPIMRKALEPLDDIDQDRYQRYEQAKKDWEKAYANDKQSAGDKPILNISISKDMTVEKLQDHQSENPDGLIVYRDEMGAWFGMMEKYGGGGKSVGYDRSYYLTAYDGGSTFVSRVGRGHVRVKNTGLDFLGGVVGETLGGMLGGPVQNDGLFQRFIPVHLLDGDTDGAPVPLVIKDRYKRLIGNLQSASPDRIDIDPFAAERRKQLVNDYISARNALAGTEEALASTISKYRSLLIRLAALLMLIENSNQLGVARTVQSRHIAAAGEIIERFIKPNHVRFFMSTIATANKNGMELAARTVLAKRLDKVQVSTLTKNVTFFKKNPDRAVIFAAMDSLQNLGWVRAVGDDIFRPDCWVVNPRVHEVFAELAKEEAEKKKQIHAIIKEGLE